MNYKQIIEAVNDISNIPSIRSRIPLFINWGMKGLERRLKLENMKTYPAAISLASGVNSISVPSDYIEIDYFAIIDDNTRYPIFDRVSNKYYIAHDRSPRGDTISTGRPTGLIRQGTSFIFDRYTDKSTYTYEWSYYAHQTPLALDTDSNWWTTNAEDLLIYASLVELVPLLPLVKVGKNLASDPRAKDWVMFMEKKIKEIERAENRDKGSGGRSRTRYID